MDVLVIGIAGGTGSGKTTLMKSLMGQFDEEITVLSHDNYYRAHNDLPYEERCKLNYDELRAGHAVQCPVYDFTVHNRSDQVILLEPKSVIMVEGILIFQNKALRDLMDIKIFVDTDADIRLCRRIKRDVNKRGRSMESVLLQYQATVKPMHDQYVEPSKKFADLVVLEGGKNLVALDMIMNRIQRHIEQNR